MEIGAMTLKRRKLDIVGDSLKDPFFDNYEEEGLECCDIINLVNNSKEDLITLTFGRHFLKKIVRSHIFHIQNIEKALNCPQQR